mmetsp:Transcript_629/g.1490  ORF Transcript_629/g.1490 Transcript_629/m.1490 type:complete len:264 (-) Transcript_629:270-1061(-)
MHLNIEGQNLLRHPHGFSRPNPKLTKQTLRPILSLLFDEWHGRIQRQFQHIPGASVQIQQCWICVSGVPSDISPGIVQTRDWGFGSLNYFQDWFRLFCFTKSFQCHTHIKQDGRFVGLGQRLSVILDGESQVIQILAIASSRFQRSCNSLVGFWRRKGVDFRGHSVQPNRRICIAQCLGTDESQPDECIGQYGLAVFLVEIRHVPKIFGQFQKALKQSSRLVKGIASKPGLSRLVELVSSSKGPVGLSNHGIPGQGFVNELGE